MAKENNPVNDDLVKLLKSALKRAKRGQIQSAAVVTAAGPGFMPDVASVGVPANDLALYGVTVQQLAFSLFTQRMQEAQQAANPPAPAADSDEG